MVELIYFALHKITLYLYASRCLELVHPGELLQRSSFGRTTDQWLKRTLFAVEYQALTGGSDVRVTIFCPGLSRNADSATYY